MLAEKYGFCKPGKARPGRKPKPLPINLCKLHSRVPLDRCFSGRVFPSGDFSVGIVPPRRMRAADKEYERTRGKITRKVITWEENGQDYHEIAYLPKESCVTSPNLVSGAKFSHRGKYGGKGITAYGKKMVRSGSRILQDEWGLQRTGFGTLTLPSLPSEAMELIAKDWSILVNRFFKEFVREQRRHGGDERYVCVTEIQEGRLRRHGELGLHIHFVYQARKVPRGTDWNISASWCRDTWRRILKNRLGDVCTNIPLPRCELKLVRKDAAGYIGKYMSKGVEVLNEVKEAMPGVCLPSSWWGCNDNLRRDIKRRIIRLGTESAFALWAWAGNDVLPSEIYFAKSIEITSDVYGVRRVGIVGRGSYLGIKNYLDSLTSEKYVT